MGIFNGGVATTETLAIVTQRQIKGYEQVRQRHNGNGYGIRTETLDVRGFPTLPLALGNAMLNLSGRQLAVADHDGVLIPGIPEAHAWQQPSILSSVHWNPNYFPEPDRDSLKQYMEAGPNRVIATSVSLPFLRRQGPLNKILETLGIPNFVHFQRGEEEAWKSAKGQRFKDVILRFLDELMGVNHLLLFEDIHHPFKPLSKKADKFGAAGSALGYLSDLVHSILPQAHPDPTSHLFLISPEFYRPSRFDQETAQFIPLEP